MMYSIRGKILHQTDTQIVIEDSSGVAWEIELSQRSSRHFAANADPGTEPGCTVYTYLHHREDVMALFGFHSPREKEFFLLLNKVNGVGPKQALRMLGAADPERIARAVVQNDPSFLSSLPGIGAKGSAKLILALSEPAEAFLHAVPLNGEEGASYIESHMEKDLAHLVQALSDMGFDRREASTAVKDVAASNPEAAEGELLRLAIIRLS